MNAKSDTRARLRDKATIVDALARHRQNHYCSEVATAIIDGELQMLAIESSRYWSGDAVRVDVERECVIVDPLTHRAWVTQPTTATTILDCSRDLELRHA